MATVKKSLAAAKALIDTPEKWAQHSYQTGMGCMCVIGALAKALGHNPLNDTPPDLGAPERALDKAAREVGFGNAVHLNDDLRTTHADIMALFDRAIAAQDEPA